MWSLIICSYYAFSYPLPFDIAYLAKLVEWRPLLLLYLALLLFAFTLAFVISRRHSFIRVFFKIASILQVMAALLFMALGLTGIYKTHQKYKEMIWETKKRAENDIQKDAVTFVSYGLPVYDSTDLKKDSIRARYGISTSFYCVLGPIEEKADAYYEQLTADYLNKRNGRGWKKRMQKELDACCP
ncbi:hypothetical protein LQ567_21960 [Niabella pedocola]|uniref:Uncharacterized protein n=1 Tax=Niabella pedocola TaxID=1752077 RepID=A0ABS8PWN0_9BACT|nr:hypothetical protein [Niabella pedocola]MCD2425465.1 hypothetical protein [Niabella pedocola]